MINHISLSKDSYSIREILDIAKETFNFKIVKVKKDGTRTLNKTYDTYIRRYFKDNKIEPYSNKQRKTRYSKEDVEKFFQTPEVFQYFLQKSKDEAKVWNDLADHHAKNVLPSIAYGSDSENTEIKFAKNFMSEQERKKIFSGPVDPQIKEFADSLSERNEESYKVPSAIIQKAKMEIALDYILKKCIKIDEEKLEKDLWYNCYGDLNDPETVKSIFNLNQPSLYYTER